MVEPDGSLDSILIQLGDFGKYQSVMFGLISLGVILHSGVHVAFVFTAMDLTYRCEIPECDSAYQFETPWLKNAVPFSQHEPVKCQRYATNQTNISENCTSPTHFTPIIEKCNRFVYKSEAKSILQEYSLQCDENRWKLALVGTINSFGQFFGLFISGIVSDKYGRKVVFILGLIFCGICGLAQTFAPSYTWFVVLEFLNAVFGAGSYMCGFVIGIELVSPAKRLLLGSIICGCYTVGEVFAAGSAWYFQDWRCVIYTLYGPPMLLFCYFWIIPESVRWHLSKGRMEEAKQILRKAARVNKKILNERSLNKLVPVDNVEYKTLIPELFTSKTLVLRLANCMFGWMTCGFLFYGLTLNSVTLGGNNYVNFILTALAEIPAYVACLYVANKIGRRWSLSVSFFIAAISCLAFLFIPPDLPEVSTTLWLLGKFGSTAAFTLIYVITSELFPTPLRQFMMSTCSTFARVGSMVAPQTPMLAQVWNPLPVILFTVTAIISGFLTLLLPETSNIKLPDTIDESATIGTSRGSSMNSANIK